MTTINDGYIIGVINCRQKRCGHCGERAVCADIANLTLPQGITVKATILQDRTQEEPTAISTVGLSCGCYAKFHRQLVWIQTSQGLRSGHAA